MISATTKCGCPLEEPPQNSSTTTCAPSSLNQKSYSSSSSSASIDSACASDDNSSCGCTSLPPEEIPEEPKPKFVSEIVSRGLPYKEIEAIINDNRMVLRIQKERPPPEFDPPCDCVDVNTHEPQGPTPPRKQPDIVFKKSGDGCRTISVYPHPDQKKAESSSYKSDFLGKDSKKSGAKDVVQLPTVNPEENPNIFILRIKRRCEGNDRKHKLDLEFRAPRPWSEDTIKNICSKKRM